ncbi:acyl-CoA dehydrogenase family protein [Rugamonas apoptosis]|uniref:Acyl-CoA dehydrogenase/oxidase C-terminal domain-containing protein n=1 Tax=Rugamonas apoptosis TaxID=2758570 RepID=A0A7W2ILB2_9BURK|nr:acyl-CoA dehydrogenase family protein [Rugamonas apoptosis]MBA5688261.1 hypothetical protein [Rugamonas apoptosis]
MTIDASDVDALLCEVEIFARERIGYASERPELPISEEMLVALTGEAVELGLLPVNGGEPGFSLWEDADGAGAMAFNMGLLRHIGRGNAGLAFAWHRSALARHVAGCVGARERLGETVLGATLVSVGHYGLAQASLGQFLAGRDPRAAYPTLADWLDRRSHPGVLTAPSSWKAVLWPVWADNRIAWQMPPRRDLLVEPLRPQHGFDELSSFRAQVAPAADLPLHAAPGDDRTFYARVLKLDMLGLLAIGAGAVERARDLAVDYATLRRQGGKAIAGHAAVQQMLGDIELAVRQANAVIAGLSRPIEDLSMQEVAAARATTHTLLCHAANQSIQAHGGLGYMRDVGAEKIVRDQNMLKLQAGGILEIPLLLAGLREEQV